LPYPLPSGRAARRHWRALRRTGAASGRTAFGLVAVFCVSFAPRAALAYCRTTTCEPKEEDCALDRQGCATRGEYVFWPDACVTYAVQSRGSPLRGISAYDTDQVMRKA